MISICLARTRRFAAATEADAVRIDLASRLSLSSPLPAPTPIWCNRRSPAAIDAINVRKQAKTSCASDWRSNWKTPAPYRKRIAHPCRGSRSRPIDGRSRWRASSWRRWWAKVPIAAWISRCPPTKNSRRSAYPPPFRRPDRAAARYVVPACAPWQPQAHDVAHADFYPNINLTGYAGIRRWEFAILSPPAR